MDTDSNDAAACSSAPAELPTLLHPTAQTSSSTDTIARSQSPAKRLKSEEAPNNPVPHSLEDTADPMDEDTPEVTRGVSVDMSDVLAGSSEVAAPSTAATSITSAPRPSADEMFNLVFKAQVEGRMVEGDVWYIISGPWLGRFMQNECGNSLSKEDDEGELGPIDNSDLVEVPQKANLDQSNTDDEVFVSEELILIKPGNCGDDFEIVQEHVWESLVSWYGLAPGSPIIKRRVVNTSELGDGPNLQFEFYPPKFTVFKLRDPSAPITKDSLQNEKSQSPKEFITTKAEKFQKFLQKVKRLADVEPSRKIRLWKVLGNFTEEEAEAIPQGVKKPNREKSPGMFGKLIIDLQPFLELQVGSERELINVTDSSNNANYNGNLRVSTAGVGAGGIIVVEEQSSEGGWISEKNVKSATRFGQPVTVTSYGKPTAITPTSKKNTTSRSSSPSASTAKHSPSKVTVIRGRREGRPQGKCGLSNLGNTCYMNSALQCLRSVKELSRYFISDEYEKELNPGNPLAHHGKVAKAYASLLKNIFSPTCPASFAPREFKTTIGRFGPSFQGYGQQDSQEFLAFLLDGLHEDLNRIQKKPYIEKPESTDEMVGDMEAIAKLASEHWGIYKKRNDSAVADLFGGLYQSTLVCPECSKVSITFDPFMDLTLPLPVENVWSKEIFFIPKDDSKGKLLKIPVEMDKNGSIKSLKEYVGKKMGIDPRMIMASEVYKHRFFKHYDDSATVSDQIQHNDDAYLYELDDIPTNWPSKNKKPKKSLYYGSASSYQFGEEEEEPQPGAPETERLLVPVFNRVYKESKFSRSANLEGFAFPFFILVNREEANSLDAIMSKVVEKYQLLTSQNLYEHVQEGCDDVEDYEEANEGVEMNKQKEKVAGDDGQEGGGKDGFVNVSMKDAGSVQDSENADEAEGRPPQNTNRRGLPTGLQELFNVKVSKRKPGDASLLTGWQSLEASLDIRERLYPDNPPTPPPRKPSVFPAAGGNSGRRSPESVSDTDNFEDAPEPEADMMQDASDDEENPPYGQNSFSRPINVAFEPAINSDFYGNNSANSSVKALKTPSRTPSPTILDESPLIRWGEGLICEWTESGWDAIFGGKNEDDLRGRAMWNDMPVYNDQELYNRRRRREDRKNKGIHLEDCLDEFAKNEVLSEEDPWYCPRCKVHRRATKKFELWKCPDILVIHLKRFSSSRNFRDKIDVLIDCPVEGLDLSNRVGLKEEDHGLIYDLIAVDNHYGGLGGGHYTAYAKNWIDDKWYYCDDSNVREVLDADKVITPAAYLLFYRRRASRPLGGPHYERLISALEGASEDSADETGSSRDASPNRAGEGGLSDDRTHRSSGGGVGGFSTIYSDQVGNGILWGGGSGSTTKAFEDEQLPAYSSLKPDDSEESGIEMTSLLTVEPQPVELSYTELKNELIKDMDESDPEAENSGGGVFLQQIEQDDGEPADIVVDGEDTITPAPDQAS